MKHFSVDT